MCIVHSSVLEEGSGIRKEETHDETEVEAQEKEEEEQPFLCPHPQPAVISTRVNSKDVVRTSDIRVSDRTPLFSLRLKQFEPIYNELTGEVHVCVCVCMYVCVCVCVCLHMGMCACFCV